MPRRRAGIYVRISSDPAGERAGVKRQEEDCRALAQRRGWDVADVYCDNDISAWTGKARPSYNRMLDDIKNGLIDAVVVWHLDRLHRHPKELESFFEVCDAAGLRDLASVTGDVDLATDDGRFMARIQGAVAKKSSDDASRRIRRKAEDLAKAGKLSGGGTRAFGYEQDRRTIKPEEAKLIKEAARRILAGESVRGIVRDWNNRAIRTPTGKTWMPTSFRRMLVSAHIAGLRAHHGVVIAKGSEWTGILNEATHERLKGILLHPSRAKYDGRSARKYLLTGFLICGVCGARLIARPRQDRRRAHICAKGPGFSGCGKTATLAEPLEDLVAEAVISALDSAALTKRLRAHSRSDREEQELLTEIREVEATMAAAAADFYDNKMIGRAEFMAARDRLDARVQAAKRQLSRLDRGTVLANLPTGAEALRAAWAERDVDWKRALLSTVVERVVINRGVKGRTRFDAERFELIWCA